MQVGYSLDASHAQILYLMAGVGHFDGPFIGFLVLSILEFRSLVLAPPYLVLECFLSPFLLATCLGGTKGAVSEINSATSKTLQGVGPWAIPSIVGLECQDL